jgi:hypothetical protein
MTNNFNEQLFNNLIASINSCTEKYYANTFPNDKQDFTKCCTEEEKDILKKCIQILQSESNFKSNKEEDVYSGLIQYYYSSIVLEYYVLTETNDYKCFTLMNETYPGAVKVRDAITISNDPWASKIRRLINFAVFTNYSKKLEEESSVKPEELKESVIKPEELKESIRKPEELKESIRKPEELKESIRKPEELKESSSKTEETNIFHEKIFNLLINGINSCTEKYYASDFPNDEQDFKKCCTEEEKDIFKKCIQILQTESNFKSNKEKDAIDVYLGLMQYYYTIVLEYNELTNYNCFAALNKIYPGAVKVLNAIFYSPEPWASKIQNLLDNAIVSGGYKKRILNRIKSVGKKKRNLNRIKSVGKRKSLDRRKSVGKRKSLDRRKSVSKKKKTNKKRLTKRR